MSTFQSFLPVKPIGFGESPATPVFKAASPAQFSSHGVDEKPDGPCLPIVRRHADQVIQARLSDSDGIGACGNLTGLARHAAMNRRSFYSITRRTGINPAARLEMHSAARAEYIRQAALV
jgi:hypothetical protein